MVLIALAGWLPKEEILGEVVRWAIPVGCAFLYGRISAAFKKWNGLDAAMAGLSTAISSMKDEITGTLKTQQAAFKEQIETLEKGIETRFTQMKQQIEGIDGGLHKLRNKTGMLVQRQEIKIRRTNDRLNVLLRILNPEDADKLAAQWAAEDEYDQRMSLQEDVPSTG